MSRVEEVWQAKPLTLEQRYKKVYAPGPHGQQWDHAWVFDKVDDGAARIKLHSDADGLLITIAIGGDFDPGIHPYIVALSGNGGESTIYHNNTLIARVPRTPVMVHKQPTWVWFRFLHGQLFVGFGDTVGHNTVIGGLTPHPLGGMYRRFGVGKLANNGAFELLDVQPLERRRRERWD